MTAMRAPADGRAPSASFALLALSSPAASPASPARPTRVVRRWPLSRRDRAPSAWVPGIVLASSLAIRSSNLASAAVRGRVAEVRRPGSPRSCSLGSDSHRCGTVVKLLPRGLGLPLPPRFPFHRARWDPRPRPAPRPGVASRICSWDRSSPLFRRGGILTLRPAPGRSCDGTRRSAPRSRLVARPQGCGFPGVSLVPKVPRADPKRRPCVGYRFRFPIVSRGSTSGPRQKPETGSTNGRPP